jgi:2-keto-3-deoxy-L-rhamnonate aldolase RhmA
LKLSAPGTGNALKRKLEANEVALALAVNQARTPNISMIAAACGFDALYIDLEHNPTSLETTSVICVAALGLGVTPLVRVSSHMGHEAARVLDGGAQGLMIPHVNTAAEAQAVVDACRFPPIGHRSAGGAGPSLFYQPMPQGEINDHLNRETILIAMIETPEAVENAEAIAAVQGIDVLHIGSNDLCTEMGIPGQYHHPRLLEAYERVGRACTAHGKRLGVGGIWTDLQLQTQLIGLGARFLITGSDVHYMMRAARADLAGLRAIAAA